ncbi:MAG: CpsD/CapB family tyrosine-protein kinase [Desulfatitalea sp.]
MNEITVAPPNYSRSIHIPFDLQRARENRCLISNPDSPEAQSYKVLRVKIHLQMQQKNLRTVLITSPRPGEGKTLTAVNLALIFAQSYDQTVLVVDCDLNRQAVHKTLAIDSQVGLKDYLMDAKPLQEVFIWPGIEKLTLISGGGPVANSPEVIGSKRMGVLVKELKHRYDNRLVLFDAPPLLGCADALALLPYMDCFVMVVAEGQTTLRDLRKALEVVPEEKFLGFVMNRQKQGPSVRHE